MKDVLLPTVEVKFYVCDVHLESFRVRVHLESFRVRGRKEVGDIKRGKKKIGAKMAGKE